MRSARSRWHRWPRTCWRCMWARACRPFFCCRRARGSSVPARSWRCCPPAPLRMGRLRDWLAFAGAILVVERHRASARRRLVGPGRGSGRGGDRAVGPCRTTRPVPHQSTAAPASRGLRRLDLVLALSMALADHRDQPILPGASVGAAGGGCGAGIDDDLCERLSWWFVERPFRDKQLPIRRVRLTAAVGVLALTACRGDAYSERGAAQPSEHRGGGTQSGRRHELSLSGVGLSGLRSFTRLHHEPRRPHDPADADVVLLGNSHAQMYAPVWRSILAGRNRTRPAGPGQQMSAHRAGEHQPGMHRLSHGPISTAYRTSNACANRHRRIQLAA